eukprot:TRINITY_DN13189_c0_g1_i1.p1 TRINITY_DN13189_c0_g1~~TRINITY_DN13189_c0_g1_i1.p1  ORF type:complete len:141 (+),score=4.61 TRINITY_DN13189_c0_g1_i1:60-482(+)
MAQEPDTKPVVQWTIREVYLWAQNEVRIREQLCKLLKEQEVDGAALLESTVESFERWGIPGGPALRLAKAVASLKEPTASTTDVLLSKIEELENKIKELEVQPRVTTRSSHLPFNRRKANRHLDLRYRRTTILTPVISTF